MDIYKNEWLKSFFEASLKETDIQVFDAISGELDRLNNNLELIASENVVSQAVMSAQGSVLTNKYAEGYPLHRYYAGCEYVDVIEKLAISRAKKLFGCKFANVQPHSGSQANQAVFMSVLQPGDTILGMDLGAGGHLTHGAKPNLSGKWFNVVSYGLNNNGYLDYEAVAALAEQHKPKLIICGASSYPRKIDFARFGKIAKDTGAYLLADVAHVSGMVITGFHPHPFPHAHFVTTTVHKTLRGARGGMVLTNDGVLAKKIKSAIFPGLQGGPLMHSIAGKAVAFKEASTDNFKQYINQVLLNSSSLSDVLIKRGLNVLTGGTDNHIVLLDLSCKKITGLLAEEELDKIGITCNKNAVPNDKEKPSITSGIRLGSPAATTRGLGVEEFGEIGSIIADLIAALQEGSQEEARQPLRNRVTAITEKFPIYSSLR